jgi:hypothetical protein
VRGAGAVSGLEWTDVGGSHVKLTSLDVPVPLLAAVSIGDRGACRAMAYLDATDARAVVAWLTERLGGTTHEAALREIVALDEVEGDDLSRTPDYWLGVGTAADIARRALGVSGVTP